MNYQDIILAGEKAKPLFALRESGEFKQQIQVLKSIMKEKGMEAGIIKIQLYCENIENREEESFVIHSSDIGSFILYIEHFNL